MSVAATPRPTLVLLPGLLCDAAVWADVAAALPEADCVVPHYGLIDTIPAMAQQVLATVPGDHLCVAGHSMGGRVALEIARLAPHRVERIALLDTGYQARPANEAGATEKRNRLALLQRAREQGMRAMGREWAAGMVHPAHRDAPVFEAILQMIERSSPQQFDAQIHALLARPEASDVLAGLRCPTLLACGREDSWSPLARHQDMQLLAPHAPLVVFEDAGHMAPMEQPQAVAAALRDWLAA